MTVDQSLAGQWRERRRNPQRPNFLPDLLAVLDVHDEFACISVDGVITAIARPGPECLGIDNPGGLVGQRFVDLLSPGFTTAIDDLLMLREIEPSPIPVRLKGPDGAMFDMELTVHPARELGRGHAVVRLRDLHRRASVALNAQISDEGFRSFVEHSMNLVCLCKNNVIQYMNQRGFAMLGGPLPSRIIGRPFWELFHGVYREIFAEDPLALNGEHGVIPVLLARNDGKSMNAELMVTPLPSADGAAGFLLQARDITAQIRAVAALRLLNQDLERNVAERTFEIASQRILAEKQSQFIHRLLEAVPNPIWWQDTTGRLLGHNRAFREISGMGESSADCPADLLLTACRINEAADLEALRTGKSLRFDRRIRTLEGEEHEVIVCTSLYENEAGAPAGTIGVMIDITQRKEMEEELRRLATIDPLTGVFNRRHFLASAEAEMKRARRHGQPLAVMMLDIDHFKNVNDTHGHAIGDAVIKAFAETTAAHLRAGDYLGRLGGEEFAILMPMAHAADAAALADRLRRQVGERRVPAGDGTAVTFTASIGVSEIDGAMSLSAALSAADAALYQAKNSGRNKVMVYSGAPVPPANRAMSLVTRPLCAMVRALFQGWCGRRR